MLQPGTAVDTDGGDLVVERTDGRLVAAPAPGGTMTPLQVVALLRGAASARAVVQELLDRCAAWESRA